MKDMNKVVGSLLDLGETLLPLLAPGSSAALAAGKKFVEHLDEVRQVASADDQGELDQLREDIEERVNAKVDDTIDRLRG